MTTMNNGAKFLYVNLNSVHNIILFSIFEIFWSFILHFIAVDPHIDIIIAKIGRKDSIFFNILCTNEVQSTTIGHLLSGMRTQICQTRKQTSPSDHTTTN
jgi:hypothetical protein